MQSSGFERKKSICQPANVSLAFNSQILTMTGDAVVPTESSSDLSNFVTSAILNGAEWNDNTTILPDTDYTIKLTFGENRKGMQFNTAGELEYTLPDALLNSWLASAQEFDLKIDGHTVTGNKARLSEDGTVKTHTVKLTAGPYTLSETAAPDGYNIAASITFTIDKKGNVTSETTDAVTGNKVTVETPNGSKAVYFDNRFMKFPDGFYKEGVLSITKLFKDSTD